MAIGLNIFSDEQSHVLLNPRLSQEVQNRIHKALENPPLKNHIWLASSGTENVRHGALKIVALSKHAFLVAAESVCKTFGISKTDIYLNTLPLFHVGGLSTLARALVTQSTHLQVPQTQKWEATAFCEQLRAKKVSITSLVPTQIFDFVAQSIKAPPDLRFVFVGGGAMADELEARAKELGWNIVSTYGMTETAAMLAYKKTPTSKAYTLFPHVEDCRAADDGCLQLRSQALLSGYIYVSESGATEFVDPRLDGWFTAGDKVVVRGRELELFGRESELVKIKGESVSLFDVNLSFEKFCLQKNILQKSFVVALPDARDGFRLCLVVEGMLEPSVVEAFNITQLPFQRILKTVSLETIPLTPVGKVDIKAVLRLVSL
ncbi:MAG: AMP-binding protein [Bdellovibrionaceae bacterium]|nr:AMP-binding protein [Pseudobdellovibrionaceae bacterium]